MAKRMTDTEKWDDKWFSRLTNGEKLIFIWLCDKVDAAGFWEVDIRKMSNDLDLTHEECMGGLKVLTRVWQGSTKVLAIPSQGFGKGQDDVDENGWVWIPNFIRFQCNTTKLSSSNRFHAFILHILDDMKNRLSYHQGLAKGLPMYCQDLAKGDKEKTRQDKDKTEKDSVLNSGNRSPEGKGVAPVSATPPSKPQPAPANGDPHAADRHKGHTGLYAKLAGTIFQTISYEDWVNLCRTYPKACYKRIVEDAIAFARNCTEDEKIKNPWAFLKSGFSKSDFENNGGVNTEKLNEQRKKGRFLDLEDYPSSRQSIVGCDPSLAEQEEWRKADQAGRRAMLDKWESEENQKAC